MSDFHVRLVRVADESAWRALFRGYAEFYGVTLSEDIADRVWRWLHDPAHVLEGLVVVDAHGRVVGLAHIRACPRPLGGNDIGFLDDMYVEPETRGSGAADALFDALRDLARKRGWPAIRWVTQHFNERARGFYDRYTGAPSDFILYHWTPDTR